MLAHIIVTTFNYLQCTKLLARSILENTHVPYRLIFVDDGSADGTAEWLKQNVPNATVIENGGKRHGWWGGNNLGLKVGEADYYAFLDRDMIVTSNWLGKLIGLLEKQPKVGVVSPVMNCGAGDQALPQGGPPSAENIVQRFYGVKEGAFLSWDDLMKYLPIRQYEDVYPYVLRFGELVEKQYANTFIYQAPLWFHCAVVPNRIVKDVGMFDEDFFWSNGDLDYSYRCLKKGYLTAVRRDAFVFHGGIKTKPALGGGESGVHYALFSKGTNTWKKKYNLDASDPGVWERLLPHKNVMELS